MDRPDRRKVRKGTRSCWECKRRKAKCIYSTSSGRHFCEGCERRGTQCVSQELPDPGAPKHSRGTLSRVEALLERLLEESSTGGIEQADSQRLTALRREGGRTAPSLAILRSGIDSVGGSQPLSDNEIRTSLRSLVPPFVSPYNNTLNKSRHEAIRDAFIEVWPSEKDLDIILDVPLGLEECSHGLVMALCVPDGDARGQERRLPRHMFELPKTGTHPVVYARTTLILAICLQSSATLWKKPNSHQDPLRDLAARVVQTSSHLVNCHDDLVGSMEGIECISMESLYHSYTGDLRRAWVTLRRAMTLAQAMGLHRRVRPPVVMETGRATLEARPEQVWFMLVHLDRYLSLMLGLPQCSSESPFATPRELESCSPEEQLRRIDCHSAGLILQRRESSADSYDILIEADKTLQDAAARMPPRWWLYTSNDDRATHAEQLAIIKEHIRHYHLLSQLHWPSLLRRDSNSGYEYSKITAVNASRETLARCIALQKIEPAGQCYSAISRIAFMAGVAICLAHIEHQSSVQHSSVFAACFAHQRSQDRAMIEQALELMERGRDLYFDTASSRTAQAFRNVLAIYEEASSGIKLIVTNMEGDDQTGEISGEVTDKGLRLSMPFGTVILIERCAEADLPLAPTETFAGNNAYTNRTLVNNMLLVDSPWDMEGWDDRL